MNPRWGKRPAPQQWRAPDEGETVAYSGSSLDMLLRSPEMRALSDLDIIDVEETVVIPGSASSWRTPAPAPLPAYSHYERGGRYSPNHTVYEPAPPSAATIAPVAYTLSQAVAVRPPRPRRASRISIAFSVAAVGILVGLVGGRWLADDSDGARTHVARQVAHHERIDEKNALVMLSSPTAAAKRPSRLPLTSSAIRSAAGAPARPAVAPALAAEATSDAQLLRAAQLEQSL